MKEERKANTKRSGKTIEKNGKIIMFAKTERKLNVEKKEDVKGNIPIWAESETAIALAIDLGITNDKHFVKGSVKRKMHKTEQKDIKNPTSTAESGLNKIIMNPAIASEFKLS